MKTQVEMKRELFGCAITQQSKTEFFSATDLVRAGNLWRKDKGVGDFNLSHFMKSEPFLEFKKEIEEKYGNAITTSRGKGASTWVHPLIFIDIALAINPKLKVEVYEWLFDNLIKFRNDSGDSYKEMCSSIYTRFEDKREFPNYIQKVANTIKSELGVEDWQKATEEQLKKRDSIHAAIKLLCNVLNDTDQAVRLGILEHTRPSLRK